MLLNKFTNVNFTNNIAKKNILLSLVDFTPPSALNDQKSLGRIGLNAILSAFTQNTKAFR